MIVRQWCVMVLLVVFAVNVCRGADEGARSPVLLIGDSMMKLPGMALERELSKQPGVTAHAFAGIGTGLARLDAFDWLAKITELCAAHSPNVAVVALGANDRQPIRRAEGHGIVQPETPEWEAEYAARIGQAMDRFIAGGCERIIWLLLPPMRDPVVDRFAQRLNSLVETEAGKRPEVTLFDVGRLVADRRTGGFTERMTDPKTAAAVAVRDRDGVHLTPQGARMLASALIEQYWKMENTPQ